MTQDEARKAGEYCWTVTDCGKLGLHMFPLGDTRDHLDKNCPCGAAQSDPEIPDMWIHNSFDGREAFEEGERKVS